uniref:RNA-directed DNA polymerase n=1 Tax=Rhipicephalus microplus TaxID=6941 RepID=A0A6G5AC06_RHIMP
MSSNKRNFKHNREKVSSLSFPQLCGKKYYKRATMTPTSGHLGVTRTLARISQHYYWPKLLSSVQRYVRTCRECQRQKAPRAKPAGLLHPIDPPKAPFQQVEMDLLRPFPTTLLGKKWIIVATDYLTRYAETDSLHRGTAAEVAKFFVQSIVLRHSPPTVVITDRGPAFTAELMECLLNTTHTVHRKTTAYHPQSNGLTECLNRTLVDMISMYVGVKHKKWDEILP